MKPISTENNFVYLTVALVFLLFAGALVDQYASSLGQRLVQAATVLTLAIGVFSLKTTKFWYRTGIGMVVAIILVVLAGVMLDLAGLDYLHLLILLCFFIWATWLAARQVLFTGIIDGNKIVGAVCIYLLLGLIWTLLYLMIAEATPNAFNGLTQAPWYDNFPAVAYYSYVTLTTLGYGDISPIQPVARFLVYMEAVVGVFYMAILVASLIGVGINESKKH